MHTTKLAIEFAGQVEKLVGVIFFVESEPRPIMRFLPDNPTVVELQPRLPSGDHLHVVLGWTR